MSILLPPLFTTVRVNKFNDTEKGSIEKEIKNYLQQVYKEQKLPVEPTVYRHPILKNVCVIPSVRRNVKPNGKVVVVDKLCGMAILRGADAFVPGILCMPKGLKVNDDVAVYAHVSGKCLKGMVKFDGEKLFVGNARALISRDDIFKRTVEKGVALKMKESLFFAPCLDNILPNKIFMQNLPSILVGRVLDPQPGEMVLDMCAAPGGKLLHLYELMGGKGKLIGVDRSSRRCSKILNNMKKMLIAFSSIEILTMDSRDLCSKDLEEKKFKCESFDRILLDAPCSALGQRPRFVFAETKQTTSYFTLQKQLFSTAVELLKPGGTLVYSTCTTTVEENEGLVEWALQQHMSIALSKQKPHLGKFGRRNCTSLTQDQLECLQYFQPPEAISLDDFSKFTQTPNPQVAASVCQNGEKTLPEDDTIGFFIAKFVKA